MLSGRPALPASSEERRKSSTNGVNRSGRPPMIASAIGKPSLPARSRGEPEGGRRGDEVRAVVLADPEDVQPDLLGELDLLQEVAHPRGRILVVQLRKRVDADLHRVTLAGGRRPA